MKVLCLDPSLRAFGWAVIENNDIIDGGCIETKPTKDKKILKSDDDTNSLKEIASELKKILDKYPCQNIIFEHPVGSKSSRANQSLSYIKGLVVSACVFSGADFTTIKAKTVKKLLTNDLNASKDDILQKVREKFKSFDKKTKDLTKIKLYAVSDAAAVYIGLEPKQESI